MMRKMFCFFALFTTCHANVICRFNGRLGNQLFQVATAIALSEEQGCALYFPDLNKLDQETDDYGLNQLKSNYRYLFHRLPQSSIPILPEHFYEEPDPAFHPIPYQPNIEIRGFFLSDKFFSKYKPRILELFAPSLEIEQYLKEHFRPILEHPKSVGIHIRTGHLEYSLNNFDPKVYDNYLPPDKEFIRRALKLFDEDALFVVFSDHIDWCKKNFSDLKRNFLFVEDQEYIYDFYLLSRCKHAIIANSSFSWWAAYLNPNPEKKIVCRKPFWSYGEPSDRDILCDGWISIFMSQKPPVPEFNIP